MRFKTADAQRDAGYAARNRADAARAAGRFDDAQELYGEAIEHYNAAAAGYTRIAMIAWGAVSVAVLVVAVVLALT